MLKELEKKIESISQQDKIAFFSAMIFGLFAHYFAITTKITNHDDIRETVCDQNQLFFGRWFKATASDVSGDISMTFNCLLGLIYIALAAAIVVNLLKIKSTVIAMIMGALMTTYPSITFNNLYQGTADVYALDILLTVLGTYVAVKIKNKICAVVLPVILMTLGLGIYQAYLGVAFGLFIIIGLLELAYESKPFKQVLLDEIRYLLTGILSLLSYLAIQKIVTRTTGVELDSYQSIDKIGNNYLVMFPYRLRLAVTKSMGFFLKNDKSVHYQWLTYLLIILVLCSGIALLIQVFKANMGKWEVALSAVLMLCFPIAAGFIYLEGADHVHLLIMYCTIVLPLFVLSMIDRTENTLLEVSQAYIRRFGYIFQGLGIIVFSFLIYNYITLANVVYTIDYYVYEESYSYAQSLATTIRNTPGYTKNSNIYMVGQYKSEAEAIPEFLEADYRTKEFVDLGLDRDFNDVYSKNTFYWYYLGLTNTIKEIDLDDAREMGADHLSVYPSNNSIVDINGDIFIRFE